MNLDRQIEATLHHRDFFEERQIRPKMTGGLAHNDALNAPAIQYLVEMILRGKLPRFKNIQVISQSVRLPE